MNDGQATSEENQVQDRLRRHLSKHSIELHVIDDKTLVHLDDLPFKIEDLPDVYTDFRKVRLCFLLRRHHINLAD